MTDKLLAEWFWTDRWMGSRGFLLPMEARGVYREMLTQAWRRGARLPNDPEAIQRAIGCTAQEWSRSWPKLSAFWRVDGDSLVNDTQLEVYAQAEQSAKRASERGKKGAQATAQARAQAHAQATEEHALKPQPPSPSPSPSPNTEPTNGKQAGLSPLVVGDGSPALPPADRIERAIRQSTDALRTKLYALVDEAVRLDPRKRDPTELMRLFTRYDKGEKRVSGVVNAALLTHERLEKSIADAEVVLTRWKNGVN